MRVVWGSYKKQAQKLYAWLIPDQLQVSPGARLLVQGANGWYTALYASRTEEDYSGSAPTGSVVRLLQRGEVAPEIEKQQALQPKEKPSSLRRETAAWQADGLDIQPYLDKGFDDSEKLAELRLALRMHFPVEKYADPQKRLRWIRKARMRQLRELAELAGYLPAGCTPEQTEQILLGLQDGLDISVYASPAIGWHVMRELRFALIDGMDIAPLLKLSRKEIRVARVDYEAAHGLPSPEK